MVAIAEQKKMLREFQEATKVACERLGNANYPNAACELALTSGYVIGLLIGHAPQLFAAESPSKTEPQPRVPFSRD